MANKIAIEEALTRLARVALDQWGIVPRDLRLHSQSENTVFRVEAESSAVYALRVHRQGYHDLAALESEHAWTAALAASGLFVPESVPTNDGRAYATATLPGSTETRHVGIVKWIPGITLAQHLRQSTSVVEVARVYERLGELIADFHATTSRWSQPDGFKRHSWDAQGLVGESPFWGRFWEIDAASKVERSRLLALRNKVLDILSRDSKRAGAYGMIHADLNANNVLRQDDRLVVIDFDDAGFGWYAFDLAVAVWDRLDALTEQPRFDIVYRNLLRGYQSRNSSCESIVERVPLFMLVRTLMLLRWMQDRPETGHAGMIPMLLEMALAQGDALDT